MRLAMRRTMRKGGPGEAMPGWLSAVWSEARMELYFQRRSPTFWVLVTLLAVLCLWLVGWSSSTPLYMPGSEPFPQHQLVPFFDVVLIPFVAWRTLRRERQAGTEDLVWTRPVAASAHVLGKVLGLLLTLALLYAAEALLVYTVTSIQDARGITTAFQSHIGLQAFQQYMLGLAAYMSWIAFGTALYLLLGMLLPLPLLSAVVLPVLFFAFYILSAWLLPRGFMLYSEIPRWDQSLAGADLFWLGMALIVCSSLPYLYGRRTRLAGWTRDCARRSRYLALAALCLMASGLLIGNPVASTNIQPVDPKAVLAALRSAPPPDPPWIRRASGTTSDLTGVSCPTVSTCIAVGDAGTILASIDGGASWHRQASGTLDRFYAVGCSSSSTCVAVGFNSDVSVDVVIATTSNGGSSWQGWHLKNYSIQSGVSCVPTGYCLVAGDYGTIIARNVPGATWHSQTSGTMDGLMGISCSSSSECAAVGDPANITGGLNDTAILLLHTSDGGTTWHTQPAGGVGHLYGVSCAAGGRCVAVGMGGTILGSSDGGATWSRQASGTSTDLWAVSCASSTGCVAGGTGIILSTGDGGASWRRQSPGTVWTLAGASCPDADHCVLVGDNGVILTTSRFPL